MAEIGLLPAALLALGHLRKNETCPPWARATSSTAALIPIDRIRADEPHYSQKHRKHGMNVQVIARPDGTPLWFSRATPGRTHDLAAARAHGIVQACLTRQILVLADRASQGAGPTVRTPYHHHREQPARYQQFNRDHARLRAPGERTFAQLKPWRALRRASGSSRSLGRVIDGVSDRGYGSRSWDSRGLSSWREPADR